MLALTAMQQTDKGWNFPLGIVSVLSSRFQLI